MTEKTIKAFVAEQNQKRLLTPGPAALCEANVAGLAPFFGRGDAAYDMLETEVLDNLKKLSGHVHVARFQGSATLAIEVAVRNFFGGRVVVINSGYYAERLWSFCETLKAVGRIDHLDVTSVNNIGEIHGTYDWVAACYVETSCALKLDIDALHSLKTRTGAKLFLDATASIGLEDKHDLADVIAYSSCKGLFGLTGACFVAFNDMPETQETSFYLNLYTHLEKKTTGPYHILGSMRGILRDYAAYRQAVLNNKAAFMKGFADYLTLPTYQQPLLCTHIACHLEVEEGDYVFYTPRSPLRGSIICHLGEVHLKDKAQGDIFQGLKIVPLV